MKAVALVLFTLMFAGTTSVPAQEQMKHDEKKSGHKFALKELKVFHDVLHPLFHDALPRGDFSTIRSKLHELHKDAVAIQKAKLPKKLAGRQKEFDNKSAVLVSLLGDMVSMKDIVDDATIEKMFNDMHEAFEGLAELMK